MTGGTGQSGLHWRRVAAALANHDTRTAYAQIVLGAKLPEVNADLNDQRRNRAITALLESGLVERNAASAGSRGIRPIWRNGGSSWIASEAH